MEQWQSWRRGLTALLLVSLLKTHLPTVESKERNAVVGEAHDLHLPHTTLIDRRQTSRKKNDYDDDYFYYDDYDSKPLKKKKPNGVKAPSNGETNVFNFIRLMVMRLVWGFASMFGFQEPLSEVFNGAFVPPGADDYDDGDDGLDLEGDYRDYY